MVLLLEIQTPTFLSLNTSIVLTSKNKKRKIKLDNFFISYGIQNIKKEEWIECLILPKLKINQHFSCYKISKRFDQDISAVNMGAICIDIKDGFYFEIRNCVRRYGRNSKSEPQSRKIP